MGRSAACDVCSRGVRLQPSRTSRRTAATARQQMLDAGSGRRREGAQARPLQHPRHPHPSHRTLPYSKR